MYEMNGIYYDEHIKSYQRHMLISWLELAKSERIKAVKDQVEIHSVKVEVPKFSGGTIEIPEQTEEEKQAIQRKFKDIPTGFSIPDAVRTAEQTEEEKMAVYQRFSGIIPKIPIPESVHIDENIVSINLPDINIPDILPIDFSDIYKLLEEDKIRISRSESV